jgi:ligand-binding sensor domain-containing protein
MAVVLALLALSPPVAFAHTFSALGVGNGLKARVVPALLIDRDGFLWVGSREGLFRYDGYEPLAFLPDPANPYTISDSDIRCLYQDWAGTLWVGTYSGGLNRFDAAAGTFHRYRHDSSDAGSIEDDSVLAIADGPRGGLWVATMGGLSRLDRDTDRFEHFTQGGSDPSSLPGRQVRALHRGTSGLLWVGTIGGGVARWNPQSGTFTRFDLASLANGLPELNDVFSLHEDPEGKLWVGTRVGLVVLDPATGEARELPLPWPSEYLPVIMAMAADSDGRLWLGTLVHGVLLLDMASLEWQMDTTDFGGIGSHLRDQPQMSLALSQDMVFVGTWGSGVYRTTSHSTNFMLLDRLSSAGLRDNNITAVLATPEPGRPWLGTQTSGLQRVRVTEGAVDGQDTLADTLRNATILELARDGEGQFWAATNSGLDRLDNSGEPTGRIAYRPDDPDGFGEDVARALLTAPDGTLWVGTEGSGLYHFDGFDQQIGHYRHEARRPDSLSGDHVTALLTAADDGLWVGTRSNGLNRCRIEGWSCQRFSSDIDGDPGTQLSHFQVTSLFRDRQGQIWIGTGNGGLNQMSLGTGGAVSGFRHGIGTAHQHLQCPRIGRGQPVHLLRVGRRPAQLSERVALRPAPGGERANRLHRAGAARPIGAAAVLGRERTGDTLRRGDVHQAGRARPVRIHARVCLSSSFR